MNRTALVCTSIASVAVLGAAAIVTAGPLDPPSGPVGPSYKTLAEVEPRIAINAANTPGDADSLYRISEPGSYYLTDDILGVVGKHGIEIAAPGVTIDLNGFEVVGLLGGGAFDGITVQNGGLAGLSVRNGTLRNWGDWNLDFGNVLARNCVIEHLRSIGGAAGGLAVGPGSVLAHCTARGSGGSGISVSVGATITHCASFENSGNGFNSDVACNISHSTARDNGGNGFNLSTSAVVTACIASSNDGTGILTDSRSVVAGSVSTENGAVGIFAAVACQVSGCTVGSNGGDGVYVLGECTVRDNTCNRNGNGEPSVSGIFLSGTHNRVEGNHCAFNGRGIGAWNSPNFIIRNTCTQNQTNWDVTPGNACLVIQATLTPAAIGGSSGGVSPGSNDPNANYSY